MKFTMTIAPAISPEERNEIEITLKKLNFTVTGGGGTIQIWEIYHMKSKKS